MTKNKTLYQRRATGYEPRELDDGDGNLPTESFDKRLTSRVTEVRSTIDDINDNIIVQTDSNTQAAQLQGTQRKTYYFNGYRVEEERGGPTVSTEDWFLYLFVRLYRLFSLGTISYVGPLRWNEFFYGT